MITEKQLHNIVYMNCQDQDIILQNLVTDGLALVTVSKYCEITCQKGKEKTIYNRIKSGKLKGINISGVQFVYLNWKD